MSDTLIIFLLPLLVAAGSALLSFFLMQSKLEVAVAKERETQAELRSQLEAQKLLLDEKIKAAEESAQRRAFDDFLADFRVEERHYLRESKSLFLQRKSMILQERLFFRNIPLSNWVEHEMTVEEGGDVSQLARAASIFSAGAIGPSGKGPKLLRPGDSLPDNPTAQSTNGGH